MLLVVISHMTSSAPSNAHSFITSLRLCLMQRKPLLSELVFAESSSVVTAFFVVDRGSLTSTVPGNIINLLKVSRPFRLGAKPLAFLLLAYYLDAPLLECASYLLLKLFLKKRPGRLNLLLLSLNIAITLAQERFLRVVGVALAPGHFWRWAPHGLSTLRLWKPAPRSLEVIGFALQTNIS